jgi:hypothetical protein
MDIRASAIGQLEATYAGDPWYGTSCAGFLEGLSTADAAAHPFPGARSIWEQVLHVTAWTREVTRRLKGATPSVPPEGEWPAVIDASPAAWARDRAALGTAHAEAVAVARALGPDAWTRPIGRSREAALGTGVDVTGLIVGLAQHHAYHIGQIALTRRALSSVEHR